MFSWSYSFFKFFFAFNPLLTAFNPITDSLINEDGEEVKLDPPSGFELPPKGFDVEDMGYQEPSSDSDKVEVVVSSSSDRLQLLTPFSRWDGQDIQSLKLLKLGQKKIKNLMRQLQLENC